MDFIYTLDNKRYHTLNYYYQQKYHSKVFKVSLDAGFSCPNIDGTKGYNGCIYCSNNGSSSCLNDKFDDLITQFYTVKNKLDHKWPNSKYIGYFQAHTNTYAPTYILKEKYESILALDNVVGLNIATRCDAISPSCLDYLDILNQKTDLTIELGLQTIHTSTTKLINRCHSLDEFETMVKILRAHNIKVVVHIINGLPYETHAMMIETIKYLNKLDIQGVKIHMLHIIKGTALDYLYQTKPFHILTKDEYVNLVCDQLEWLNDKIVIHRITSDPDLGTLVEPKWLIKKFNLLNAIDQEFVKRNTYQGYKNKLQR